MPKLESQVGKSQPRSDGRSKVTGAARYAVDHVVPDMLHGVAVRSTRAHALIDDVEKAEALAIAGVVAVLTADDLGGLFPR